MTNVISHASVLALTLTLPALSRALLQTRHAALPSLYTSVAQVGAQLLRPIKEMPEYHHIPK